MTIDGGSIVGSPFSWRKIVAPLLKRRHPSQSKIRKPTFNYHLKQRPWQIQPFYIAPILPGERVKNQLWKQTSVSDPVPNRLIGWWQETTLWYVRVRDLFPASDLKSMFIDPEANLSGLYSAADPKYFHYYGVNWAKEAVTQIVENYFRADDEAPSDATIDNMFAATIGTDNWLDSAGLASDFNADIDVQLDIGTDHIFGMRELDKAQQMYEQLKAGGLTDMDYSDFLRTYGVRVPSEELEGKPKLLKSVRNWTMPANTVEPSTGVATTAMYWKLDGRHDSDFQCKEPGFLIGLQIFRPKVYLGNVRGSLTGIMDTAREWLPAILRDDPESSLIEVPAAAGPLNMNVDYYLDLRDLFLYGEQFTNQVLTAVDQNIVGLPAQTTFQKRYPDLAMSQSMFVDDAGAGTKQFVETDGRIDIVIAGNITDTTPPVSRFEV